MKSFKEHYILLDSLIISSEIFTPHSKTFFPIVIALYARDNQGMDFDFIKNYQFSTDNGRKLRLNDFNFIGNYVTKYPNPKDTRKEIAYFHTLRANSIRVFQENIRYYYYIHHFKKFADKLPYYFGNLDIFINHEEFLKVSNDFMDSTPNTRVQNYFEKLFKEYL